MKLQIALFNKTFSPSPSYLCTLPLTLTPPLSPFPVPHTLPLSPSHPPSLTLSSHPYTLLASSSHLHTLSLSPSPLPLTVTPSLIEPLPLPLPLSVSPSHPLTFSLSPLHFLSHSASHPLPLTYRTLTYIITRHNACGSADY